MRFLVSSTDSNDFPEHIGHVARDLDWIAEQASKLGPSAGALAEHILDCPFRGRACDACTR